MVVVTKKDGGPFRPLAATFCSLTTRTLERGYCPSWVGQSPGEKMLFAGGTKGIALDHDTLSLKVVAGDNPSVLVHNPQNRTIAHMLVELPRPDGGDPVLVPGNPVKMGRVADGHDRPVPWLGEHTDEVLRSELGLSDADLTSLRSDSVIGG